MFLAFAGLGLALMGLGAAAVAAAAWMYYPPLGIAVGGVEVFLLGLLLVTIAGDVDDEGGEGE